MGERGHSTPRHPSGDPHERATDPPATKGNSYSSADLHVLPTPVRVFEKNSFRTKFRGKDAGAAAAVRKKSAAAVTMPRLLPRCRPILSSFGKPSDVQSKNLASVGDTDQRRTSLRVQETGYRLQRSQLWQPILGKVGGRVAQRPAAADRQAPAQASTGCGLEPDPEPRARFMFWLLAQGTVGRWLLLEVRGQTRLV